MTQLLTFSIVQKCNFINGIDPSGYKYPVEDAYYGILDSLDCRFSKYIGYEMNDVYPGILTVALERFFRLLLVYVFVAAIIFLYVSILIIKD